MLQQPLNIHIPNSMSQQQNIIYPKWHLSNLTACKKISWPRTLGFKFDDITTKTRPADGGPLHRRCVWLVFGSTFINIQMVLYTRWFFVYISLSLYIYILLVAYCLLPLINYCLLPIETERYEIQRFAKGFFLRDLDTRAFNLFFKCCIRFFFMSGSRPPGKGSPGYPPASPKR